MTSVRSLQICSRNIKLNIGGLIVNLHCGDGLVLCLFIDHSHVWVQLMSSWSNNGHVHKFNLYIHCTYWKELIIGPRRHHNVKVIDSLCLLGFLSSQNLLHWFLYLISLGPSFVVHGPPTARIYLAAAKLKKCLFFQTTLLNIHFLLYSFFSLKNVSNSPIS